MSETKDVYRRALRDVIAHCDVTKTDRDTPDEGKEELGLLIDLLQGIVDADESIEEMSRKLTAGG